MTIGERIKQRRIELGLSQEELAHRLGNKTRASVSTVEHDKEDLTTDRIRKYAEALETTPAYLMGWEPLLVEKGDADRERQANRIKLALELYDEYDKLDPTRKAAIDILLKGQ